MRVDRRVSPNQTALWTVYELRNGAGQRPTVVRLACYYGRSTGVNGGQPSHLRAQVRGGELDRPPIFQAGHAGSIPVTRSRSFPPSSDGVSPWPGRHPCLHQSIFTCVWRAVGPRATHRMAPCNETRHAPMSSALCMPEYRHSTRLCASWRSGAASLSSLGSRVGCGVAGRWPNVGAVGIDSHRK